MLQKGDRKFFNSSVEKRPQVRRTSRNSKNDGVEKKNNSNKKQDKELQLKLPNKKMRLEIITDLILKHHLVRGFEIGLRERMRQSRILYKARMTGIVQESKDHVIAMNFKLQT